jgi:hypothetical protein
LPLVYRIFIALLFVGLGWGISQGIIKIDLGRYQQQIVQLKEMVLNKLFSDEHKLVLPAIPKVKHNAKSTAGFTAAKVVKLQAKASPILQDKDRQQQMRQDNFHFVNELYQSVMENEPTGSELSQWMNVLDQGGSREGVYRALVLSNKYAGLENFDRTSSDQTIQFTRDFMGTYLDQQVESEQLEKVNSYSIKRIVVEQSLELIDTFNANNPKGDQLPRWYAIISTELASNYPNLWKRKLRGTTNPQIHLQWAKSVPEQELKSELIIKLHRLFNHLDGK